MVNLFSKLYTTFILQMIAFIFGGDKEEEQFRVCVRVRAAVRACVCVSSVSNHSQIE